LSPPLPGGNEQAFVNNQVTHLKATIADGEAEVARLKDVLAHTSSSTTQDDVRKQIRTQQRLVGYWQRAYVELISVEPSSDAGGLQILDSANPVLVPLETLYGRDHYDFPPAEEPPWRWKVESVYPG